MNSVRGSNCKCITAGAISPHCWTLVGSEGGETLWGCSLLSCPGRGLIAHEMLHFVRSRGHVYPRERLGLPTLSFRGSSVLESPSLVLTPVASGRKHFQIASLRYPEKLPGLWARVQKGENQRSLVNLAMKELLGEEGAGVKRTRSKSPGSPDLIACPPLTPCLPPGSHSGWSPMLDLCSLWGPESIGRLGCAQDCSVLVSPPSKGQCMCPQRTLAQHVHSGSGSLRGELALGDHLLYASPVPVFCVMVTQAIGCWLMSPTPQEGTERWEYL